MNKKQAGIIVTLLALIVCAGILAARVNTPMDGEGFNEPVFKFGTKDNTTSKSDFFVTARLERDNAGSKHLETLSTLMGNKNLSQAERDEASKQSRLVAKNQENETNIELALKARGFEDAICFIGDDKVRVVLRTKEQLTKQQEIQVKDVVNSYVKGKALEIERKQ